MVWSTDGYRTHDGQGVIAADSGVIREVAESVMSVRTAVDGNESEFNSAKNILSEAFIGPGADTLTECLELIKSRNTVVSDGLLQLNTALMNYADNVDSTVAKIQETVRG